MEGLGDRPVLVVAQSARALAAAGRRAGQDIVTIDFFADDDTQALALEAVRYEGDWGEGFRADRLLPLIEAVAARRGPLAGVVLGSGFEDRPEVIDIIAKSYPLFSMTGAAVQAVKAPEVLSEACRELGVPFPEVAREVPDAGCWVVKKVGGTGGVHVTVRSHGPIEHDAYAQRYVAGCQMAALCLGSGDSAVVIAFSEQWPDPTPEMPFRFAGVLGPVALAERTAAEVAGAAKGLARRFGLRGLFTLDLMVGDGEWWLTEINPRIGASIDVLDHFEVPLFAAHVAAFQDKPVVIGAGDATIRASQVVFANASVRVITVDDWPEWVRDRPKFGSSIEAGAPVATVVAEAPTAAECRRLLDERARWLKTIAGGME
ncbi:ATP-grasp domain-containing protein [Oryzibacter oryziterrae]|uniref:ATP-grasp domain-containing protein n=1 Tax=Oryzibacter oryziterrae TaxID=2766474 RepID=UPI001F00194E|nr:ATP-grasp domain-containing protein [Oryzibacter oryziterrae]